MGKLLTQARADTLTGFLNLFNYITPPTDYTAPNQLIWLYNAIPAFGYVFNTEALLHFPALNIPYGAKIESAKLRLTPAQTIAPPGDIEVGGVTSAAQWAQRKNISYFRHTEELPMTVYNTLAQPIHAVNGTSLTGHTVFIQENGANPAPTGDKDVLPGGLVIINNGAPANYDLFSISVSKIAQTGPADGTITAELYDTGYTNTVPAMEDGAGAWATYIDKDLSDFEFVAESTPKDNSLLPLLNLKTVSFSFSSGPLVTLRPNGVYLVVLRIENNTTGTIVLQGRKYNTTNDCPAEKSALFVSTNPGTMYSTKGRGLRLRTPSININSAAPKLRGVPPNPWAPQQDYFGTRRTLFTPATFVNGVEQEWGNDGADSDFDLAAIIQALVDESFYKKESGLLLSLAGPPGDPGPQIPFLNDALNPAVLEICYVPWGPDRPGEATWGQDADTAASWGEDAAVAPCWAPEHPCDEDPVTICADPLLIAHDPLCDPTPAWAEDGPATTPWTVDPPVEDC